MKNAVIRYPYYVSKGLWIHKSYKIETILSVDGHVYSIRVEDWEIPPQGCKMVNYISLRKGDIGRFYAKEEEIDFLFEVVKKEKDEIIVKIIKDTSSDGYDWTGIETRLYLSAYENIKYIKKIKKEDIPLELLK